ncbi:MAG: wax ester/triacylglycerol synthase family O-acyltransferase [Caldilineae bacterium]|nr:MAG: wax ester/triacylglycerol synthase family O-acyltransferase [Caldilineae bacterium]
MPVSKPLSNVDAAWLGMEDPTNLMMVTGVLVFDEPLDLERFRATIRYRLLRHERFRQRVIYPSGRLSKPRWETDPNFDLSAHIIRLTLPPPGDQAALEEMVSMLMSTPLDYTKPLWQIHVLENFGEGCALLVRLHHCIADGIALMHVLLSLADDRPDAPWPSPEPEPEERRRNPLSALFRRATSAAITGLRLTEKVVHESLVTLENPAHALQLARTGADFAAAVGRLALRPPDPPTLFKGKLGVAKRAAWSGPVPLRDVKAIGRVTGGTVNDILLTAMTGALRRYMESRGEPVEGLNFRAVVPVNLRPPEKAGELGNQFGLVFLSLPIGIADPVDRLFELKRRMDALKGTPEAVVALGILGALGVTPQELQNIVVNIFGAKATAVMTNVPGPRQTLYLAGSPIRTLMFWVPQSGRLGLGVSILSYAGEVRLGVATDARLVPDPQKIAAAFHDEFASLMDLVRVAEAVEHENTPSPAAPSADHCQATTRAGQPCKNKPLPGSPYCWRHQPAGE